MPTLRIALLTIRLVMRTKVALFFTFIFPLVFLFVYAVLIARGNPEVVAYVFGPVITLNIGKPFRLTPSNNKPDKQETARLAEEIMAHIAALLPPEQQGRY